MTNHRTFNGYLGVVLLLCWTGNAGSQPPGEAAVNSNGSVVIKKAPELMRVQVELLAKGKDLKEALAKLKARREAAVTALVGLGASRDAIDLGDAALSTDKSPNQMQMEMMVRQNRRQQGKKDADKGKENPVVVGLMCKVDFPLKAGSADELLLAAQALQEKIKAADISGKKEIEKLSPQEEELAEEMPDQNFGYNGAEMPKPGEPAFSFVAKITDEERDKALAEAFRKAKAEAARLAKAAGADLGTLQGLNSSFQAANDADAQNAMNNPYYYQMAQRFRGNLGTEAEEQANEAVGMSAGKVSLRVMVSATFRLRAK